MSYDYKRIKGVIVPTITPLDQNGNVDEKAFRRVIARCLDGGAEGVFVGGTSGFGPLLTQRNWQAAMEIAFSAVDNDHCLLGGVIETSTVRAIEKIRILEQIGFKAAAITPTFYITLTEDAQMLAHFGACREATDMEMVVYNIPSCTHSCISVAVLRTMAERGWFSVMKESSGDRAYFQKVMELAKAFGINVLQGHELDIAWGLTLGAVGIVPVCGNFEPTTFAAAVNAARSGDAALLEAAQKRAIYIRDILLIQSGHWLSGIMYGLSAQGIGNGVPLLPLLELAPEKKKAIDALEVTDITSCCSK